MLSKYLNKYFPKTQRQKSQNSFYLTDEFFQSSPTVTAEEYANNVIVFRCVNIIAQSASHVPWVIYEKTTSARPTRLNHHPLYGLLKRPNHMQAGADFFSELVASKLLYGSCYILGSGDKMPTSLYLLHPKQVTPVVENGKLSHYLYKTHNQEIKFPINHKSSSSKVLHLKSYNPSSNTTGISSLKAASKSIELHNNTTSWNNNLLKNGARPSGALVMKDSSTYLSEEQFSRLQEQLYEKFTSSSNAGRPLLLEGGLDWREMSINPKDMDFIESKNAAAREIALAFGLPPQLLGITGDNTYSNMQEARLALWEETIIPLLDKIADNLSNWLSTWQNREIIIDFDRDAISALSEKRQNILEKISTANFMTINEKRNLVGLGPIAGGDKL